MKVLVYIEIDGDLDVRTNEDAEQIVTQVVRDGADCNALYAKITLLDVINNSPLSE